MQLSVTESQTLAALRTFLLTILPPGVEVVRGQDNRVAEPQGPDFVTMTPLFRERLEWNTDSYSDTAFIGSIDGQTLTVTGMKLGAIQVGNTLFGNGIAAGTIITAQGSGTGGVGTYTISQPQTVVSQIMAAGTKSVLQPVKVTVQLDVHGPNSADNVHAITTLFRNEFGVQAFHASGFDVTPLYADEAHQMPFINGEQQVEERWVADLIMQCNPILTVPQQFADQLDVTIETPL